MNKYVWRPMLPDDLNPVMALSARVHPTLPESLETQTQRRRLYSQGCLVLAHGSTIMGYAFCHPIRHAAPPSLDSAPQYVPPDADELYLHDFVVHDSLRGRGHAGTGVRRLLALADGFATMGLISVYGTTPFWTKFGFTPCQDVPPAKLRSYGADAVYMVRRTANDLPPP